MSPGPAPMDVVAEPGPEQDAPATEATEATEAREATEAAAEAAS